MSMDGVNAEAFKNAKSYLEKPNGDGASLYKHLTDALYRVIRDQPADPLPTFAALAGGAAADGPVAAPAKAAAPAAAEASEADKAVLDAFAAEPSDANEGEVADVERQLSLAAHAGVALGGSAAATHAALALRALVSKRPLRSARLVGKIIGTQKDYLIAEAEYKEGYRAEDTADVAETAAGPIPAEEEEGANTYVYFACNGVGSEWTRLPDVDPTHIAAARLITARFTGNLDAEVRSFPPFPGSEAVYLRAQIARIVAATTVAPRDYYIPDMPEDEEADDEADIDDQNIIVNDEYEAPAAEEAGAAEAWVHTRPYLLPQGRTRWVDPDPRDEDEEQNSEDGEYDDERSEAPRAEPEEGPAVLTELATDAAFGDVPAWGIRTHARTHGGGAYIAAAHSTVWPGAVAVAPVGAGAAGAPVTLYVGTGLRAHATGYTPPAWAPPADEPAAPAEQDDPTVEEERAAEGEHSDSEDEGEDPASDEEEDE